MSTSLPIEIHQQAPNKLKPLPKSEDYGFGNHFSDHWFVSRYSVDKGWHQASVEPYGPLALDPAASVFHYGQALFEGMKVFRRKDKSLWAFRPEFNFQRLCDSAHRLCLEPPTREIFMQGMKKLVQVDSRWVPHEDQCSLYLRPTLIGTEAFLGVRPSREQVFFIILSPAGFYYAEGDKPVRIWVEDKALRAAPGGLGAVKAGANYAASLQAALLAKEKGFAQVLWLDVDRQGIEEVGTMNVFFVFKNEVVTPALNGSILPGGVRDSVIQLLKHWNQPLVQRRITVAEVLERHKKGELLEAFGTGTAAVISRIGELCYRGESIHIKYGADSLSAKILNTVTEIQRGTQKDPFGWMIPVDSIS